MSGMILPRALNLVVSFSESTHNIRIDHFPEKRAMMLRTGQVSIAEYFFRFSDMSKSLIFNNGYFSVSALPAGKFLQTNWIDSIFAVTKIINTN